MEITEAKKLVIKAGLELVNSGLIARTWGNVSCRIDDCSFAITPSGREYSTLTLDDIVEVRIEDLHYSGSVKPSSEKGIHAAVYKKRSDINFVIHTHQENASAISATELDSFIPDSEFSSLGTSVICVKYALPGTKSLKNNVEEVLNLHNNNAYILKHHGALCLGTSYEETFKVAHDLESACGIFINRAGAEIQLDMPENPLKTPAEISRLISNLSLQFKSSGKNGYLLFNNDFDVKRYSALGKSMVPLLDDFAQIIGTKIKTTSKNQQEVFNALKKVSAVFIKDYGAVCWGDTKSDAEAVSMILRKNCKAFFAASAFGRPKPIKMFECFLMRTNYIKNYSKMSEKNKQGTKND